MWEYLIVIPSLIVLQHLILLLLPFKKKEFPYTLNPFQLPKISILLAVKNEQKTIESCVNSLLAQRYPNFELLVSNDHSDDNTGIILESFGGQIHLINGPEYKKGTNPKVAQLIELKAKAQGVWLAVADGDCIYSEDWLISMVHSAENSKSVLASGVTEVAFGGYQNFDWLINQAKIGVVSLKKPLHALGNNMILLKEIEEKEKLFESALKIPTEDIYIQHILTQSGYSTDFSNNKITAQTFPVEGSNFWEQRKRWITGLKYLTPPVLILLLLESLMLPLIICGIVFSNFGNIYGLIWLFNYILAALYSYKVYKGWQRKWQMKLLFYEIRKQFNSLLFVIFIIFAPKFEWKGRKF